ncbi:plasmid mobilization protein [Rhizobium sp. Leaf453]|uniref:plasmid mobilization protein n=1 Tax=Rhizobium sp. Leaf453 TaxID=1736380 RepID=UPI000AB2D457
MGRPPVPTHLKRDKRLVVMLTDDESLMLAEAAKNAGAASVSDWVREVLLGRAEGKL